MASKLPFFLRALWFVLCLAAIRVPARAVFPDRTSPNFKSVGMIGRGSGSAFKISGSGVAIAPDWVLAVSHVGGDTFIQEGKQYPILKKYPYKAGQGEPADLALFKMGSPAAYSAQILDAPFDGKGGLHGQAICLVGYGETCKPRADGKGWQPIPGSEGKKRVAMNVIDKEITDRYNLGTDANPKWRTSETLVFDIDKPGDQKFSTLGSKIVANEGGIAAKDSGGGWFVKVQGKEMLVAISATVGRVVSANMPSPYCYGGLGFGVYLTPYRSWIEQTMRNG